MNLIIIPILFTSLILIRMNVDKDNKNNKNNVTGFDPIENIENINFNSLLEADKTMHNISTSNDLLLINECSENHKNIKNVLKKKFDSIKIILKWWNEGNITSVLNAVKLMKDKIIMNDFFYYAIVKNEYNKIPLGIDSIIEILTMCFKLCQEKYESYIRTGIETIYIVLLIYKNKYINQNKEVLKDDVKFKVKETINEVNKLEIINKIKEKKYNEEIYKLTMKLSVLLDEINLSNK